MGNQQEVERKSFDEHLTQLKKGIRTAWFVNWLSMFLVVMAGLIATFMSVDSTNAEIGSFITVAAVISLVVSLIAMAVISRISPRLMLSQSCEGMEEITDGVVYNVVAEMSIAASLNPMPKVYVADTDAINAYAMSDGKNYCVVFTRPLLQRVDREELKGITGHEIGHIVMQDCEAMTKLAALTSTVSVIAGMATRLTTGGRDNGRGGVNPFALAIIILSFVFLLAAPFLSGIARQYMSRERESQADATSVRLTRNPNALAKALLAVESASIRPDGGVDGLQSATSRKFYKTVGDLAFWGPKSMMASHPPTMNRVKALVSMGANPGYIQVCEQLEGNEDE